MDNVFNVGLDLAERHHSIYTTEPIVLPLLPATTAPARQNVAVERIATG